MRQRQLDLPWPELAGDGAARDDQYLCADGTMLVAPIIPFDGSSPVAKNPTRVPGNASRSVWVPPGAWQDGWTGVQVSGPRTIQVMDCPMDRIPLWRQNGSVLVSTAPGGATSEQDWDALIAEVFPFPLLGRWGGAQPRCAVVDQRFLQHQGRPRRATTDPADSGAGCQQRLYKAPDWQGARAPAHCACRFTCSGPLVDLGFISPAALVNATNPPIGGTGSVVVGLLCTRWPTTKTRRCILRLPAGPQVILRT